MNRHDPNLSEFLLKLSYRAELLNPSIKPNSPLPKTFGALLRCK